MSEFDDERLQGAMRAYLRAVDTLAGAAGDYDDKAMLDAADTKRLAELVLRSRLTESGWTLTRRGGSTPTAFGDAASDAAAEGKSIGS